MRLVEAADRLPEAVGASWPVNCVAGRERALAAIRAALGEATAAVAREEPLERIVAEALEPDRAAPDGEEQHRL